MGLKCSILGHTYGESTVERDREEQGSEVVITIQETETCTRCGNTRVVSENKEVTAIETPSDIAGDVVEEGDGEAATATAQEAEHTGDGEGGVDPERGADESADTPTQPSPTPPGEDDAEIMDSGDGAQSGDAELDEPSTTAVPDAEEPTAPEHDPEEDDAVILDETTDDEPDREPGEWPEEAAGDDDADGGEQQDEWEPVSTDAAAEDEPDVEPLGGTAVTVPEGQFRCPECGFTTDVEASSLRAGDFCPECQKGALVTETTE